LPAIRRYCGSVSTVPLRRAVSRAIDASDFENRVAGIGEKPGGESRKYGGPAPQLGGAV
jgi:hypothetical protein